MDYKNLFFNIIKIIKIQKESKFRFSNLFIKNFFNTNFNSTSNISNKNNLIGAAEWLCRAQDVIKFGGVSGGFSLERGWFPPYPETTGYIIPTFLKLSIFLKDQSYIARATSLGDWEIKFR